MVSAAGQPARSCRVSRRPAGACALRAACAPMKSGSAVPVGPLAGAGASRRARGGAATLRDAFAQWRGDAWRALAAAPFYRQTLIGPAPSALRLKLNERWPGDPRRGNAILAGNIEFAGELIRRPTPAWFPPDATAEMAVPVARIRLARRSDRGRHLGARPGPRADPELAFRGRGMASGDMAPRCRGDAHPRLDRAFRGTRRPRCRPRAAARDAGEHRGAGAASGARRRLGADRRGPAARAEGADRRIGRARRAGTAHHCGRCAASNASCRRRSCPMAGT